MKGKEENGEERKIREKKEKNKKGLVFGLGVGKGEIRILMGCRLEVSLRWKLRFAMEILNGDCMG